MSRFKRLARAEGLKIDDFTFHWSRATFATMWARAARANGNLHEFMPTLKRMMAHKHDRTTERYIQWVEKEAVRALAFVARGGDVQTNGTEHYGVICRTVPVGAAGAACEAAVAMGAGHGF